MTVYRVETERLRMRCWSPGDATLLRAALDASDAHLRPHIPWMRDEPRPVEETAAWLRMKRSDFDRDIAYRYAMLDPSEETLLGEVALFTRSGEGSREIGYWLDLRHGGKGYAMEATKAMIRVAFEIDGVDRVEIHCSPLNESSAAIPRKLGFEHEATLRRRILDSEGEYQDSMLWTLFAADYPRCPAKELSIRAFDCMGVQIR